MNVVFSKEELAKFTMRDWGWVHNMGKVGTALLEEVDNAMQEQFASDETVSVMIDNDGKISVGLPFTD
jgi:hypothetical protein